MPRLLAFALLFLLGSGTAWSDWEVSGSQDHPSRDGAVIYRRISLEESETGGRATLDCALFDSAEASLRVIDQPGSDLAEVIKQHHALAGVNGGYFDPENAPVGLLVSESRVLSPLRKAKLLTGVLFATRGKVDIIRTGRFAMSGKIRAAVQCGPLLVDAAQSVGGLNDSRAARRTFAVVDGKGRATMGVSSPVSLAQLARILCRANLFGKTKVARALNLDGGSSSAFWFAGRERTISIPELKPVRDFVAIAPRTDR